MKKNGLLNGLLKGACAVVLAIGIAIACVGCVNHKAPAHSPDGEPSGGELPPSWAGNFNLPDADGAMSKLNEIYGGADKVFLLQNQKIARMPCPQDEVVTLNATFEIGEYARLILEDSIAEFNEVFAQINPNYRFAINYSPAEVDFTKKYSVRFSASDNLPATETSQVFGVAHVSYYQNFTELGDFGITVKSEVFNNGAYLMMTFKHELMHLLGAGDAYKNSAATKATVMQSYTVNGYHSLSKTDVAFLDALYRNPEFSGEDEKILAYINGYEENSLHTKGKLTAAIYNKLVADLSPEAVTESAEGIGYKDLTEFSATVRSGINPDSSFGSQNISFKELEYAVPPAETYFGSIEPQENRYWHGKQTSIGSSQGIKYTDYGNGVLFAAPNGNIYIIMIRTGEFVLTFKLGGSFTNFADLALVLWHVSK